MIGHQFSGALNAGRVITLTGKNRRTIMEVIKDLIGGIKPATIELPYNGSLDVDCVTLRYKGSLCKIMNVADIDNGNSFVTFAGLTTAMVNVCGILEEEQEITSNYLHNSATYAMRYRKITPIFPSTIIQAEYVQADKAAVANYDTNASVAAGGTLFVNGDALGADDQMIGGWVYMLNGDAQYELHYVTDQANVGDTFTFATAVTGAVVAADDWLCIRPPMTPLLLFNATYTDIFSKAIYSELLHTVNGLSTWISAPNIPMQKLNRNKHDGLVVPNARFYHQFTIPNNATLFNFWIEGR